MWAAGLVRSPEISPEGHLKALSLVSTVANVRKAIASWPWPSCISDDSATESIATARAEAEKEGLTNIEFIVGDAENIQYPDDTFDIAHAHQVMIHLAHPVQSLRQIYRIIKPGGVVGIRDLSIFHQLGATDLMNDNLDKFWKSSKARGAEGEGAGLKNHIWMHEAGFEWKQIRSGSAGYENHKEELPAIGEGQMAFAKMRGESDKYLEKLKSDWDDWAVSPEARGVGLDGWVIGVK